MLKFKQTEYFLELYRLNELTNREKEVLYKTALQEASIIQSIKKLDQSTHEILKHYAPKQTVGEIIKRYQIQQKNKQKWKKTKKNSIPVLLLRSMPIMAACLIALLGIVFWVFLVKPIGRTTEESAIEKNTVSDSDNSTVNEAVQGRGSSTHGFNHVHAHPPPYIKVYRKGKIYGEELENKATASKGDIIQLSYFRGNANYGVIFSIDGSGMVTLHYPYSEQDTLSLFGADEKLLKYAYQLDNAPTFEKFFFISSVEPFDMEFIMDCAEKLAQSPERALTENLELSSSFHQYTFTLLLENE